MHDMAKPLNHHELINRDRSRLCNSRQIITRQINQHQMLRALFLIGKKLFSKSYILFTSCTARSGTSDRMRGRTTLLEGHQGFWGRTNNLERNTLSILKVKEVHVG